MLVRNSPRTVLRMRKRRLDATVNKPRDAGHARITYYSIAPLPASRTPRSPLTLLACANDLLLGWNGVLL